MSSCQNAKVMKSKSLKYRNFQADRPHNESKGHGTNISRYYFMNRSGCISMSIMLDQWTLKITCKDRKRLQSEKS